jgi:hypothetical protein
MKLLELFSGTATLSKIADGRGWKIITADNDPGCGADWIIDLASVMPESLTVFVPDVVWASPPCESFSVASIGHHWESSGKPKTRQTIEALSLIKNLSAIIRHFKVLNPSLIFFIENPRGMMRKVEPFSIELAPLNRHTVTYCQYGETRQKPTDIWTNCWRWIPRKACNPGDNCHEAAPRGARTGTQGRSTYLDRSRLPIKLCEEILTACENQSFDERHGL